MKNKRIHSFESYRDLKKVNESAIQIADTYKVGGVEITQSFINSYVRKVKDETGKDLKNFYSDIEIADMIVKTQFADLKPEDISSYALLGGDVETVASEETPVDTELGAETIGDAESNEVEPVAPGETQMHELEPVSDFEDPEAESEIETLDGEESDESTPNIEPTEAEGDTAEGDTAEGDTAEGDTITETEPSEEEENKDEEDSLEDIDLDA